MKTSVIVRYHRSALWGSHLSVRKLLMDYNIEHGQEFKGNPHFHESLLTYENPCSIYRRHIHKVGYSDAPPVIELRFSP